MGDLIALVAPIFSTPRNYAQMLKKLAGFAFYETYLITLLLRDIPEVGAAFRAVETYGSLGKAVQVISHASALNIAGLGIALVVAVITFAVHFHDRLSDIFGIRRTFDRDAIVVPLALLVGISPSKEQLQRFEKQRDSLMREVFYRYASSRADQPLVDKHDIEHALAAWSWFWVALEGISLFVIALLVACFYAAFGLAAVFFSIAAILAVFLLFQYPRLERYARPQIEAIARDSTASQEVRARINAL